MGLKAINIYSEKDHITKQYAEPLLDNPNYDIQIVPCISKVSERSLYFADHAFMGKTYQTALKNQLDKFQTFYGFYDEKKR